MKKIMHLTLIIIIIIGCILIAGCVTPMIKEKKTTESPSPNVTPSDNETSPVVTMTIAPVHTQNSTGSNKGLLNVSIGDFIAEIPVFVDNKSVGVVSTNKPLNLTTNVGRHTVSICVADLCNNQDIIVLSSSPTMVDYGDWLKKDIVTGPLTVSIDGYNAELPVFVDNASVGNASQYTQLDLMVSEGNHTVKVCVGIICENESVAVKFASPLYVDFGERLKRDAEFPVPTIRLIDFKQIGSKVTANLEFINPSKDDLTMTTTIELGFSYIDYQSKTRHGASTQNTVTKSIKAGNRTTLSSDIWMSGGSSYNSEIPQILNVTFQKIQK